MKIQAKLLKGEAFEVEIDPEAKVQELKKKIAECKSEFPADASKLIYSGRILVDDHQVKEYNIKEGEFVVVMVAKAKGAAAPAATAATPAESAAAPATAPAAVSSQATADPTAPVSYEQAASTLVTGGSMEPTIQQLMDMGFERPQVESCLRAAFNNPDRAVEYLMSGIPAGLGAPAAGDGAPADAAPAPEGQAGAPAAAGGPSPFPAMPTGGGGGGAGDGGDNSGALDALRNSPQLGQLAQMVAANPAMLQQILPAIAQQNPGIVQAIQENPEEFMRILQEAAGPRPPPTNDPVAAMLAAVGQGGGAGAGGAPGRAPGAPRPHVIQLSEEERAAVQRLAALGFDPQMAAQAYLACDKNEEAAANFLFDDSMQD
jgi:UV excision repair protein RAD23